MNLFVFGCGYSASHFLRDHASRFDAIWATTRGQNTNVPFPRVEHHIFDGRNASAIVRSSLAKANVILVSIPPGADGDPVFNHFGTDIALGGLPCTIIYLSTIGVYGDHAGGWVDETTTPRPKSTRSIARLKAEENWQKLGARRGCNVHILRLAGIYGPKQNALENLRAGNARPINKPGQVFNRIHVADISAAIAAAVDHPAGGIWNVSDDEPAPPQDVIAYAASLLGIKGPAEVPFEAAEMTAMARSFYSENKRVSNRRFRQILGVELAFPTFREGLSALAQTMRPSSMATGQAI